MLCLRKTDIAKLNILLEGFLFAVEQVQLWLCHWPSHSIRKGNFFFLFFFFKSLLRRGSPKSQLLTCPLTKQAGISTFLRQQVIELIPPCCSTAIHKTVSERQTDTPDRYPFQRAVAGTVAHWVRQARAHKNWESVYHFRCQADMFNPPLQLLPGKRQHHRECVCCEGSETQLICVNLSDYLLGEAKREKKGRASLGVGVGC